MGNKKKQREAYDKHAREYQRYVERIHDAYFPITVKQWKELCKNRSILDIGCGSGFLEEHLARDCKSIIAMDLSKKQIELAKEKFPDNENIQFVVGDAEDIDFPECSFDVVLSYGLLHHVSNPEKVVKNAHRVLKPGGRFIALEPMRCQIRSELDFWSVFFPFMKYGAIANCRRIIFAFAKSFKGKESQYLKEHPGSPGKRSHEFYMDLFKEIGVGGKIEDIFFPILPIALITSNTYLYKIIVWISYRIGKQRSLKGKGTVALLEFKK